MLFFFLKPSFHQWLVRSFAWSQPFLRSGRGRHPGTGATRHPLYLSWPTRRRYRNGKDAAAAGADLQAFGLFTSDSD
ncbi:MAG: hypothetical protein OEY56_07285 [Cyclobacteriaceae bacterium]|nr:hypothetical protein [Cyclobacteriaceae bacterium]